MGKVPGIMTIINPGLRLVWRDQSTVQIGLGSGGTIVAGLDSADASFIRALRDGICDVELASVAAACGVGARRRDEIIGALGGLLFADSAMAPRGFSEEKLLPEKAALMGLYHDSVEEMLSSRSKSSVHLIGLGRTGASIAHLLLNAGVGSIFLEDDSHVTAVDVGPAAYQVADIGLVRSVAARRNAGGFDAGERLHVVRSSARHTASPEHVDLIIVVTHDAVDQQTSARFMHSDTPQLFVLTREQDATVGPLIIPGQTACAECVEHHRSESEPLWMDFCQQLADPAEGPPLAVPKVPSLDKATPTRSLIQRDQPAEMVAPRKARNTGRHQSQALESSATAMSIAGVAGAQALLYLDGVNRPGAWSAVMTFHCDLAIWSRQEYSAHPGCSCQLQHQALATISSTAAP